MFTALIIFTVIATIACTMLIQYEIQTTLLNKRIDDLLKNRPDHKINVSEYNKNNIPNVSCVEDDYSKLRHIAKIDSLSKYNLEYNPNTHTYTKVQVIDDKEVKVIRGHLSKLK